MIKADVLNACRCLLDPIARLLLRTGVTWDEFAELGKQVFVDVARRDYGLQGRPTNTARVALMTGLSRREVTRVKEILVGSTPAAAPVQNRIATVLTGWHLDPEFSGAAGPAVLPAEGARSLAALLKRYAGDHPHGALLKELIQLGLVVEQPDGYRVTSRHYLRSASDPDIVRQAGVALRDHAATLVHNADAARSEPPRFEGMATNPRISRRHARAFREHVDRRAQAFLEEIDAWLSEHETPGSENPDATPADSRTLRCGIGVYLIHDEI